MSKSSFKIAFEGGQAQFAPRTAHHHRDEGARPVPGGCETAWRLWKRVCLAVILSLSLCPSRAVAQQRADGQLRLDVVDSKSGQPMAVRMQLKNSRGRPVALRLPGTAAFGGHFYIDGQVTLALPAGQYTFSVEGPPDYKPYIGPKNYFEITRNANDSNVLRMERAVDLGKEGWWAGDLDVARRAVDLPLVMRAEGLKAAADRADGKGRRGRRTNARGVQGEQQANYKANLQEGPGGELLVFPKAGAASGATLRVARTPYAWNLPVWLAKGELDAIQLIHHHSLADGVVDNENDGRPRDHRLFPGKSGNERWSEAVYYHVLNCGLRIPPAAGSGSGGNDNPVGANRVYAYCGDEFSPQRWWEALATGRVFVTNGPLLRPMVEGQPPGYVFRIGEGDHLSLEIGLTLSMRSPVEYLEIVKNGQPEADVRLADFKDKKGRLPPVTFDESGWFLVRTVTNNESRFELASTGPYYVERAGRPRISKQSVQFFLDWIDAASDHIRKLPKLDETEQAAMLAEQATARAFFEGLFVKANAE